MAGPSQGWAECGSAGSGVRTAWSGTAGPSAHQAWCWPRGAASPCGSRGNPPTWELGKVSLKKVGNQDSRMKKEQAAESWEKMAALQVQVPLRPTVPSPQGGQRPWGPWLCDQSVLGTHSVPTLCPAPPQGDPAQPAHQTEGFRKSCLQGTLVCLAIGRPCAKTPKARMRSGGSKERPCESCSESGGRRLLCS